MKNKFFLAHLILFISVCCQVPLYAHAGEMTGLSSGQTLYVPAYSHIYIGDRETPFFLTITLSIRNIDFAHPITLTRVDYYETQGKLLRKILDKPVVLNSLESIRYIIPEQDKTGGSGANFIVEWTAGKSVNPPIAESIMIGAKSTQGISFTSRGRVIIKPGE